jgi:hypothetical protein
MYHTDLVRDKDKGNHHGSVQHKEVPDKMIILLMLIIYIACYEQELLKCPLKNCSNLAG